MHSKRIVSVELRMVVDLSTEIEDRQFTQRASDQLRRDLNRYVKFLNSI